MLLIFLFLLVLGWFLSTSKGSPPPPTETFKTDLNNEEDDIIFRPFKKEVPNRFRINLEQSMKNKWGFIPKDKRLTGNSQTRTYADIYSYWDPNFNYTDYWNYSYPLTVYPRRGAIDYRSFGHSTYSNLFQLSRSVPISELPFKRLLQITS